MSKSDFFVIISIAVAIAALFSEQNRKFYLMKFSLCEVGFGILLFLCVHLLVWSEKWVWWTKTWLYVENDFFPFPSTYAYILFIILLCVCIKKISSAPFPVSQHKKLLTEYVRLLSVEKFSLLASLLEKYHNQNIILVLEKEKEINEVKKEKDKRRSIECIIEIENQIEEILNNEEYDDNQLKKLDNLVSSSYMDIEASSYPDIVHESLMKRDVFLKENPQLKLAKNVYDKIIRNEEFIKHVIDFNPVFFCPFIKLSCQKNDEFVRDVLGALIKKRKEKFFNEINKFSDLVIDENTSIPEDDFPLLYSVFSDVQIALVNEVWHPLGEEAILELQAESQKEYSYLLYEKPENDYGKASLYPKSVVLATLNFFEIMGKFFIINDKFDNSWLYYYECIIRRLLGIMKCENISWIKGEGNAKIVSYHLIEKIVDSVMSLYNYADEMNRMNIVSGFSECKRKLKEIIGETPKLNDVNKEDLIIALQEFE